MSHFTVLVIGEDPEKQLAPFQENNMGNCPMEYMKFRVWDKEGKDHWFDNEEAFKASGVECDDGEEGYWENPNKKWDWYLLGGRWEGFFQLKDGASGLVGGPGLQRMDKNYKPPEFNRADQCRKRDIDIEAMRSQATIRASEQHTKFHSILNGGELPIWDSIRDKYPADKIQDARKEYWSNPATKALSDAGFWSDLQSYDVSLGQYLQEAREGAISTFAVIKDGKWYERGSMGWWGFVSDEKEQDNWNKEFAELFDSLPDETLLSVYDCHI